MGMNIGILSILIINISLMVSFVYVLNRIKPFSLEPHSSPAVKTYYSIGFVILSILNMNFSINNNGTMIDFRYIPVMVAGYFGGPLTGIVTALLAGIYLINQVYSNASIYMALSLLVLGIVSGFFCTYRFHRKLLLIIPALVGTAIAVLSEVLILTTKGVTIRSQNYVILSILYPLAFLFLVAIFKDMIKINEQRKSLEIAATVDGMTGLFNFRYFDASLKRILESATRRSQKLTVGILDLDYFKKVNDTYGHPAGDEVLRQMGDLIQKSLRPFDIAARYGGEEFAIILPECDRDDAFKVCERLRENIEKKYFIFEGQKINITASIGVTTFPDCAQTGEDLVRQSDLALYQAKKNGRNKVVLYCEESNDTEVKE